MEFNDPVSFVSEISFYSNGWSPNVYMAFAVPSTLNNYLIAASIVISEYFANPARSVYVISLLPKDLQANPLVFWSYFLYESIITLNSIGFIMIGTLSVMISLCSTKLWISQLK